MRSVWKYYFPNTEGIIFVVDASQHDSMPDVKEELWRILKDESHGPILIYANKQDLEGVLSADDII